MKTAADVRQHLADLDVDLPVDDDILRAPDSPLASSLPVGDDLVAGNRFCIHPMEGWDGTEDGLPTDNVR
ncbi:MAG: NADH:flavin oxidoreductase, partial [Candidatus Latescibacterota bacterium]|nr:NADH:flavin oxidoreductase [Candidatus Latescibacterota bacterium]